MRKKVAIIGSGFAGLSAAAYMAAGGHEVHVYEKNSTFGGRARQITTPEGYTFDMGPSWYWMPGVFDRFFKDFGYNTSDFYDLKLLSPAFDIVFGADDNISVPNNYNELRQLFELLEPGSAKQLDSFMAEAAYKYNTGIENLVYKPGLSVMEFADLKLIKGLFRLQVFSSFGKHVRKYFSHPKLIALMEFPVLFLGAMPDDTPALYSLMNYAGLRLGTWYPKGGFGSVINGMITLVQTNGGTLHANAVVEKIAVNNNHADAIIVNGTRVECDAIIGTADYHHIETKLLPEGYANYNEEYWAKKTFAPSSLIFYIGINKKLRGLNHHTLFFDADFAQHSRDIYKDAKWPSKPLFYVCCTSKSDENVAPPGHENLFLLMPVAAGLNDNAALHEQYFHLMIQRLEQRVGEQIMPYIDYRKSYCLNDFINDYNAYKGNAYGLANTLMQTAVLKPKIRNRKIANLYYAGQLTVPGPGVPPSIISGKIAAQQLIKYFKQINDEVTI